MAREGGRLLTTVSGFCSRRAWLVIGGWVVFLGVLNVAIPQLEQTVAEHSVPFLPADIPAAGTLRDMSDAFRVPPSSSMGSIVLVNENGIGDADERAYAQLVDELRADRANVAYVLDTFGTEQLRSVASSPDGKAINLMVAGTGDVGSTKAHENTVQIRELIDELPKPDGLRIYFTGPSPTLADLFSAMDFSLLIITGVSVLLIALLLLAVYRSVVTALVPLATIGVALGVARPVVSLLGLTETMAVSNFTIALMTAMVLGATTDYAIFILAGYHEGRRQQQSIDDALASAAKRVNGILLASALTIAAAAAAMGFTQLGLFRAAGPPIVVAIVIAMVVSMTLPYALIALFARRGLVEPRGADTVRRWRRTGATVIRHSKALAAASLVLLLAAASVLMTYRVNFDESAMPLGHPDSAAGYEAVQRHWGVNEAAPEYLIVRADHDMRNTDDLAALDRVAATVSSIPQIDYVRFLTRPSGQQLEETTVGYQVGIVAGRLGEADQRVRQARPDLTRLSTGVQQLAEGATSATGQLPSLVAGVRQVSTLAHTVLDVYQSSSSAADALNGKHTDLGRLVADLSSSLTLLDVAASAVQAQAPAVAAIATFSAALAPALTPQPGPDCLPNPICMRARDAITDLDVMTDGALTRLLGQTQQLASTPEDTLRRAHDAIPLVRTALTQLQALLGQTGGHTPEQSQAQLGQLVAGTERLSTGMTQLRTGLDQVQDGITQMTALTAQLSAGLQQATTYLDGLGAATNHGPASGFYLPPQGLADQRFQTGARLLFSPDGKTARMIVVWKINPYSDEALTIARQLAPTATIAAAATSLHDAEFATTGLASLSADMRDQVWRDFAVIAGVAMLGVLIVLCVLLRSILAPLFMIAVVALSFAAASGFSVLVWQYLIGIDLDWSVLPVSFMALIAVGADYSMLFAARIREYADDGMVRGIIRGFGTTGGVITTAGVVFALTMFALMSGRVINLLQIGFTVGTGLLIDVVVVRTVLVPAAMTLIGERIWWPSIPSNRTTE